MVEMRESYYLLKTASELICGDIDKELAMDKIWNITKEEIWSKRIFGNIINDNDKERYFANLENEGFILRKNDKIKVTLNGIYFIVEIFNLRHENYGILNKKDFNYFLNYIMNEIKSYYRNQDEIPLSEIRRQVMGIGDKPFNQIIHVLEKKGLIKINQKDNIRYIISKMGLLK